MIAGRNILAALTILTLILPLSAPAEQYSADLESVLEKAGDNRPELQSVLDHYRDSGDTLKLRAAKWLIRNMNGHSYVTYALVDSLGDTVAWNVQEFSSYDSLLSTFDSLEQHHPDLEFKSAVQSEDVNTITADLLIENIDLAFRAWRTRPWAQSLSWSDFRDYVLPYRASNEPLEPWRQEFIDRYSDLASRMEDSTDRIEAAALINDDIKSWFGFDRRWYYHPTDQGLAEMQQTGLGRCEDMTNLTIYAMRANGLPVTSDYTPYWANSGNNHAWNAIIVPGDSAIPFMGAEANPGKYKLNRKAAKVYRKTFAKQPDNLVFVKDEDRKVPRWLNGKSYTDVTADYGPVTDVTVVLDSLPDDSVRFAYLCVFNDGEWKPIHWAEIHNKRAVFTDMARDIAYLPGFYINEDIVPAGCAFILNSRGNREDLTCHLEDPVDLVLHGTTKRAMDRSSESVDKLKLERGEEYELLVWDADDWQTLGRAEADGDPLEFLAPSGGLYWLRKVRGDHDERIFTYEHGRQIWW